MSQLYRQTPIGKALDEALSMLIDAEVLPVEFYDKTFHHFDVCTAQHFSNNAEPMGSSSQWRVDPRDKRKEDSNSGSIKGTMEWYRSVDSVYTFVLSGRTLTLPENEQQGTLTAQQVGEEPGGQPKRGDVMLQGPAFNEPGRVAGGKPLEIPNLKIVAVDSRSVGAMLEQAAERGTIKGTGASTGPRLERADDGLDGDSDDDDGFGESDYEAMPPARPPARTLAQFDGNGDDSDFSDDNEGGPSLIVPVPAALGKRPRDASMAVGSAAAIAADAAVEAEDEDEDEDDDEEEDIDEELLGSDDDEEEGDGDGGSGGAGRSGEPTNRLFCQYDKVKRVKDQWRITLKAGIGEINGKSYAFSRADADLLYF